MFALKRTAMNALGMSRTLISYSYKAFDFKYYKHGGIIGYKKCLIFIKIQI